jgi:hypothetical protein
MAGEKQVILSRNRHAKLSERHWHTVTKARIVPSEDEETLAADLAQMGIDRAEDEYREAKDEED